jgi:predicted metal-binding membrane protein
MGTCHGIFCVGCCWAVMAVMFVVGIMNLAWVASLAALVLIERVTPLGFLVSRLGGLTMLGLGAYLLMS